MNQTVLPPASINPPYHFIPPEWHLSTPEQRIYVGDIIVVGGYTVAVTKTGEDEGMLIVVPSMDRYSDATFELQWDPTAEKPRNFISNEDLELYSRISMDMTRGRFFITEKNLEDYLEWTNGYRTPWKRWGGAV